MLKHRCDPNLYINFLLCYPAKLKEEVDVTYAIILCQAKRVPNEKRATSNKICTFLFLTVLRTICVTSSPFVSLLSVICMPQ